MYYIYFPYVLVLSGFMFFECLKKKYPKWWAAMVFFAPVTFPYFMIKSRKFKSAGILVLFLISFSLVIGAELYLWNRMKEKGKYNHLPPITRQAALFSETIKKTTTDLDNALLELERLSKVESRMDKLRDTIEFIEELRLIKAKNQEAIFRFIKLTTDYRSYFKKNKLNWIYHIREFYTHQKVIAHHDSLEKYLDSFEALLRYTYTHFDHITKAKIKEQLKNYDEYYLRYRRSVDRHNKLNVQRIEFQNAFLLKHPDTKPYLPGRRQTDTFLFWK